MPLVLGRGTLHVHLAAVGKRETDVDLIQSALAVMLTGRFEHDPARCYAAPELFELRHVRRDGVFDVRGPGHALKLDFRRRLHLLLPLVCHKRPGTTASKSCSLYLSLSGRREKEEFASSVSHLGNIEMEAADRIRLEAAQPLNRPIVNCAG